LHGIIFLNILFAQRAKFGVRFATAQTSHRALQPSATLAAYRHKVGRRTYPNFAQSIFKKLRMYYAEL